MIVMRYSHIDETEINVLEYINMLHCILLKQKVVFKLFRINEQWINYDALFANHCTIAKDNSRNDIFFFSINQIERFEIILDILSSDAFEYPAEITCYLFPPNVYALESKIHNFSYANLDKNEYLIKVSNYHEFIEVKINEEFYNNNKETIYKSLNKWELHNSDIKYKTSFKKHR